MPDGVSRSAGSSRIVLAAIAFIIAGLLPAIFFYEASQQLWVAGPGYLNARGTSVGNDFIAFYSGGQVALAGDAARAYDVDFLKTVQRAIVGGGTAITPWAYPPTYFLYVALFAGLPYLAAAWAWILLTTGGLLLAVTRLAPARWNLVLVATYPAVSLSVLLGQNGCLTAALVAAGLVLLPRRPIAAGLVFGLVLYKPHLALIVPLCLLAARQYRAVAAMAATGFVLVAGSLAAFGIEPWRAFLAHLPAHLSYVLSGAIKWDAMPTAFVAMLGLGAGQAAANAVQVVVAVAAAGGAAWVWARTEDIAPRSLALAAAALLATPFALTYDMAILAVPCAVYGKRFLDGDRSLASLALPLLVWFAPILSRSICTATGLQTGPLLHAAMLAAAIAACRRKPEPSLPAGMTAAGAIRG